MPPDSSVALKELIEYKFKVLEDKVDALSKAVASLSKDTVSRERFDLQQHNLEKLEETVEGEGGLVDRLRDVEQVNRWTARAVSAISGVIVAVAMAILIAWLRQRLGL